MLYINDKLQYTTHDLDILNISSQNIECQWVKWGRNVIIGNLYRPPQGNVQNCIDYLEDTIEQFDLTKDDLFIMGDFNIDFLSKKDNSYKLLFQFCKQFGLDPHIKSSTHFSKTKNSCIDQILSNSNFVSMAGVCNLNISDHQLVYVIRKKAKSTDKNILFWGRSYRNYDCNEFTNTLKNHEWFNVLNTECPNDMWKKIYETILYYTDLQCPLKEFKIKKVKDLWVTPELLEFIKDKDKALRKAKRTKSDEDWKIAKRLRNECLQRVRNCK